MQVLLTTCGGWHLPHTARAFAACGALAGLWISGKNAVGIPADKYHRCWTFHLAMKPFYHCAPQIWEERAFYALFPLWRAWFNRQPWPDCNVVQAIMGYATEPFDRAEKSGALKVVDCQNSHPTTLHDAWQRECDLWCPGEKVPIPRWMFERMKRELARADVVLCPSLFVRDTMTANGVPVEKCFLNPFGVDTSIFQQRTATPSRPRFICVGTICLRKGHQYLLRAFELLKARLPEAELICVGNIKTDFRNELPRWRRLFNHREGLSQKEVAVLCQSCTAFVLLSVEEGFARVIPEAMAAGLPIVATHESGASTLVTDGVEGFIVPARQPEAAAVAMEKLGRDPALSERLGTAARRKGAESNTWQDYGHRLLEKYSRQTCRDSPQEF